MTEYEETEDLISQLSKGLEDAYEAPLDDFELKEEDLKQFILNNSGRVVRDSIQMINNIKGKANSVATAEALEGVASVIKAGTSAIESLQKIQLQNDKIIAQKEIKQMDIEAKKMLKHDSDDGKVLKVTREEAIKALFSNIKLADVDQESIDV